MLKYIFLLFVVHFLTIKINGQNYWQQQVNYTIDVQLNDTLHTLDGFSAMEYINNSPDTIKFIWIHLWMNAFKNDKTAFTQQSLQSGSLKFYFSNEKEKGYINRLNFQVAGKAATVEDHPNYIDIVKVILPVPLPPKQSAIITTPFHVQLPQLFSRGGHVNQSYQITQWFPKAAMYDNQGWHPMPYLDQGEFYSNFGDYEVNITLPKNYVIAATGKLMNENEKQWLSKRADFTMPTKAKETKEKTIKTLSPIATDYTKKTISFKQSNVIDFAWFADKTFIVNTKEVVLNEGRKVLCQSFYRPENRNDWKKSIEFIERAIQFRSEKIGNYPYETVSVVDAPLFAGGGMEYPTITNVADGGDEKSLDLVIEHEIGHNWFQAVLASNERMHPWLDEGINSYYDYLYEKKYYPQKALNSKFEHLFSNEGILSVVAALKKDQPINTNSYDFTSMNYGLIAYQKTTEWMKLMASKYGEAKVIAAVKQYYETWRFRHPQPADFDQIMQSNLTDYSKHINQRSQIGELESTKKKALSILPAVGVNGYDGFMAGAVLHNYLPQSNKIRYYFANMYGFKSKKLSNLSGITYQHTQTTGKISSIKMGATYANFGTNFFESDRARLNIRYSRLVPFVRVQFKQTKPRSPFDVSLSFKHYNITEDELRFNLVQNPGDTFYQPFTAQQNRYLNQLQFNVNRWTVLYPYQLNITIEQNKDLVRSTFTAEQFFNYNNKGQGLSLRFFAGKIIYLNSTAANNFANARYDLHLLAPKGDEDYNYSTYFAKRNDFEKFGSRQVLKRDGFFRFRADLLANKPGRSDNWLASMNLTSTLPDRLNPLSILPVKIPLKVFLDMGTSANAWVKNYGGTKFLYNAGLQLSLFNNLIEIYYPLMYSKEFGDYSLQMWQKKTSSKNISFAINLNGISLRKLVPQINY